MYKNNVDIINKFNFIKLFEIERIDGYIMYFNETYEEIEINNIKYMPSFSINDSKEILLSGINQSEIPTLDLKLSSVINSNDISYKEILSGAYNNAEIRIFILKKDNAAYDKIFLEKGFIKEIIFLDNEKFFFKIESISDMMDNIFLKKYSLNCRAEFCDKKCKLNIKDFSYYGKISKTLSNKTFYDEKSSNFTNGYFENGTIFFSENNNYNNFLYKAKIEFFSNMIFEISFINNLILKNDMYFAAYPGCNKSFQMCSNRYKNAINFQGEPFIPGFESLYN
jgi:uncharacterized phage protein (TIGR02218 family)